MSLRGVKGGTLIWEEGRVAGGHEPRGEGALRGNRIGRLDRARALRRGGGGGVTRQTWTIHPFIHTM